jgi:hypothetical protein
VFRTGLEEIGVKQGPGGHILVDEYQETVRSSSSSSFLTQKTALEMF